MPEPNNNQHRDVPELLVRLDERSKSTSIEIASLKEDSRERMENLNKSIKDYFERYDARTAKVEKKLDDLETAIETKYVKKESFDLIRNIVLAVTGLILASFFVALIRLVITSSQ